ncbi:pyruvate dehydrogenase (acetyl-transferring) E1 component subunit alpha [Aliikangiella coralliicola]|uniref:Pyruvate dehydrogenase E1 component subunit alpha n=1 Tax=Aliikangiella coralliicola TaxID=2592383 RepID=A0A545TWC4_9GAMM|nr:pyruvate dehydrogenase (acetyl-transferring) E1 component subunit alpha [Aliikangiella coralliicola]TQV81520.1 pyruvate dehydrogenase (acetyl-transferring) E1 component subunit alpha [Aliikangiella coralliicola]
MTTIAKFEVKYVQYLDEHGQLTTDDVPAIAKDFTALKKLYRDMALIRQMDSKAYALQRTGKMGTYAAATGQEAIGVGFGAAMNPEDVLVPYYRGQAAMVQHGVRMEEILLYWGGDERGSDFQNETARQDFPIAVPIATQSLHATGVAKAMQIRGEKRCVFTEIGEGGTSQGDFYEALNVAGIWSLGVVFVINNNQWAISVPSEIQTACETYAQKAIAAGIDSVQVDGNDIIAVFDESQKAAEKAREGGGSTVIECISLRLCDHTTADDASRYRPDGELDEGWKKEPLIRLRKYLEANGQWSEAEESALQEEVVATVQQSVDTYLNTPTDKPEAMFDYLYDELPERTLAQRELAIARGAK